MPRLAGRLIRMVSAPVAAACSTTEVRSAAPGSNSTGVPLKPLSFSHWSVRSHDQTPFEGMLRATQAIDFEPRFFTAHCTAPRLLGTGPCLVEAMLRASKHSRTAQAEAMTAGNVKRVVRGGIRDWFDDATAQSPYAITALMEMKTVWHPMGT